MNHRDSIHDDDGHLCRDDRPERQYRMGRERGNRPISPHIRWIHQIVVVVTTEIPVKRKSTTANQRGERSAVAGKCDGERKRDRGNERSDDYPTGAIPARGFPLVSCFQHISLWAIFKFDTSSK